MKDEKVCTWCSRTGHHANHCPDPKPEMPNKSEIGDYICTKGTSGGKFELTLQVVKQIFEIEALKAKE